MIVRAALIATSVVVCAWFALGAVEVHDQNRATALLSIPGIPPKARTAQILHLLDDAGRLNPDRTIDLLRAQAHIVADQRAIAEREALAVVRDEPKNIYAWIVVAIAAVHDPAVLQQAVAQRRALAPPVPLAP